MFSFLIIIEKKANVFITIENSSFKKQKIKQIWTSYNECDSCISNLAARHIFASQTSFADNVKITIMNRRDTAKSSSYNKINVLLS